jgi:hypothetical protein
MLAWSKILLDFRKMAKLYLRRCVHVSFGQGKSLAGSCLDAHHYLPTPLSFGSGRVCGDQDHERLVKLRDALIRVEQEQYLSCPFLDSSRPNIPVVTSHLNLLLMINKELGGEPIREAKTGTQGSRD